MPSPPPARQGRLHHVDVRVGTWNLEWTRGRHRPEQALVIEAVAADIWVLTVARPAALPAGWASATSAEVPVSDVPGQSARADRQADAGCFAVVGAAKLKPVGVPDLPTAACGLAYVRGTPWLVLGVCMPWRRDRPPLPADAAPGATTGPQQWAAVLARLDDALTRLSRLVEPGHLLLAGDLNQTLSGPNVGFKKGRQDLRDLLTRHHLIAYTGYAPSLAPGYASVDHVCGPSLPHVLEPWPARALPLSDHRGYALTLGAPYGP